MVRLLCTWVQVLVKGLLACSTEEPHLRLLQGAELRQDGPTPIGINTRFLNEAFDDIEPILDRAEELVKAVLADQPALELAKALKEQMDEADIELTKEDVRDAISQSNDGIERVSKIVRAMKEFSHPGTKEMTHIDLNDAIESTVTVASNEWKYVAEMDLDFDPDLPNVLCLPGELNQVFLNMIVNAAHAIADVVGDGGSGKGTISISTRNTDAGVEIRVGDTGSGVPVDARERLFDPFFTTKEVGKGTGQGLSIAHDVIVDQHKGSLTFETECGRGTTFIIVIPASDASASEVAA